MSDRSLNISFTSRTACTTALDVTAKQRHCMQRQPHLFNLLNALFSLSNHRVVKFEVARNLSSVTSDV